MSSRSRAARTRALVLAALVLAVVAGTLPGQSGQASAESLTPGSDFTISSTVSSSATSPDPTALLHPGVTRYLWYQVTNPMPQPITVTSLGIAAVDAPAACPADNLDLGDPSFVGTLVVPAHSEMTVPAPKPISLIDLPDVNQDACKNVTFGFSFVGTARYSEEPADRKAPTATVVTATPTTAAVTNPVLLSARVTHSPKPDDDQGVGGLATPSGRVSFHQLRPDGTRVLLGEASLGPSGTVSLRVTTLPAGASTVYASYGGSTTYAGSTSPGATVSVVAPPAQCTRTYTTAIIGTPDSPVITGTPGNDFIYAVGGDYRIKARKGSDCVVAGDGNNHIADGSGTDVVIAGDGRNRIKVLSGRNTVSVGSGDGNRITIKGTRKGGRAAKSATRRFSSRNRISIGDGAGNRVWVRKGNSNRISIGDGSANRVKVRRGRGNRISVGDGASNLVWVRRGSRNGIALGNGAGNRVKVRGGYKGWIQVGDGAGNLVWARDGRKSSISVGSGDRNQVKVRKGYRSGVTVGDGDRNRVWVRFATRSRVGIGDGDRNRVTLVKGKRARVSVGDGDRNRVTIRRGTRSRVRVGDGDRNRVTVRRGNRVRVRIGDGVRSRVRVRGTANRVRLGDGRYNQVVARVPGRRATCVLPRPPSPYSGKPARYYRDRITRCRVVTR